MAGILFRLRNILAGEVIDAGHEGLAGAVAVYFAVDPEALTGGGDDFTGLLPGDGPVRALIPGQPASVDLNADSATRHC